MEWVPIYSEAGQPDLGDPYPGPASGAPSQAQPPTQPQPRAKLWLAPAGRLSIFSLLVLLVRLVLLQLLPYRLGASSEFLELLFITPTAAVPPAIRVLNVPHVKTTLEAGGIGF